VAREVLVYARMKRAILAFAILGATGPVASAGIYAGLAIGPSLETSGDGSYTSSDRTGRLIVGYSLGQISVEGGAMRGSLTQDSSNIGFDVTQLSLSGKYSLPLTDGFQAFGRLGLQRTSVDAQDTSFNGAYDTSGSGYILGAGIEYKLNLVATSASIFVDYNFASTALTSATQTTPVTLQTRGFSLGATVGF
jgi:hypothetical protein